MKRKTLTVLMLLVVAAIGAHQIATVAASDDAGAREAVEAARRAEAYAAAAAEAARRATGQAVTP